MSIRVMHLAGQLRRTAGLGECWGHFGNGDVGSVLARPQTAWLAWRNTAASAPGARGAGERRA
jgi:hypothetical protein